MPLSKPWPASPTPASPQRQGALGSRGLHLDAAVSLHRQSPAWERLGSSSSGNNIGRNNELLWGRREFSDWETYGAVTVTDGPKGPFPTTLPQWPLRSPPGLSASWCWGMVGWSERRAGDHETSKKGKNHHGLEGHYLSVSFITHINKPFGPTLFICIMRQLDLDLWERSFHHL